MKRLSVLVLCCGLIAPAWPAAAQDTPDPQGEAERGFDLLQEGANLLFRGIIDKMRPDLEQMQKGLGDAAEQLGPKLRQFIALIDDMQNYEAPTRLPNGDIVMRRKAEAPPPPPLMSEPPPDAPPKQAPQDEGPPVPNADGSIDL